MMDSFRDMKIALEIAYHIENPCRCPVSGQNIRHVYLEYARDALEHIREEAARCILEHYIERFSANEYRPLS